MDDFLNYKTGGNTGRDQIRRSKKQLENGIEYFQERRLSINEKFIAELQIVLKKR
jgi:hypothetical protein